MKVISLENVKKRFENFKLNVNLHIDSGEIVSLLGKSGSGKSSILKIIQEIIKIDEGKIVKKDSLKISYIFQDFNLLNNKNVFENVYLPLKLKKIKDDEHVNEILNFMQILDKKDKYISKLSGGEKQRVAIARALVSKPDLLLCDEITASLDDGVKVEILELLDKINKKYGVSILLVTHELNVVKHLANRVLLIEKGNIIDEFKIENRKIPNIDTNYHNYVKEFLK